MPNPCTPLGTFTTILGLCKPADAEVGWGNAIRGDLDAIDALFTGASLLKPLNGGTGVDGSAAASGAMLVGNGAGYTLQTTQPGSIALAGTLVGSGNDSAYSTTSASFVDVDATNLKVTLTVPTGAKFLFVWITFSTPTNTLITDAASHVQVLADAVAICPCVFVNKNTRDPIGIYTAYGVVATPTAGAGKTIALQFKGDGANAFVIGNKTLEGAGPEVRARMMYLVTG